MIGFLVAPSQGQIALPPPALYRVNNDEAAALARLLLRDAIDGDRYPLSPRIRMLQATSTSSFRH
jgi:hypothetical protein